MRNLSLPLSLNSRAPRLHHTREPPQHLAAAAAAEDDDDDVAFASSRSPPAPLVRPQVATAAAKSTSELDPSPAPATAPSLPLPLLLLLPEGPAGCLPSLVLLTRRRVRIRCTAGLHRKPEGESRLSFEVPIFLINH